MRDADAADLVEMMLVVAIVTIIVIRVILVLSGYPKLGGSGLHIAHVLYGGLLMILALIVLFTLLNLSARWAAALIGGIGFGFFIDEVGKFISNDVNYFFEPAFSVMYVVFVLLFLAAYLIRRTRMHPRDALANALTLLRERSDGALPPDTRREILRMLEAADSDDPLVVALRDQVRATPEAVAGRFAPKAWRRRAAAGYRRLAERHGFSVLVVVVMVLFGVVSLITVLAPFTSGAGVDGEGEGVSAFFESASAAVTAALIIAGLVARRRSRVAAYRWFKAAILVSVFITQVFVFYYDAVTALVGVIIDVLLYIALTYMISREEADEHETAAGAESPAEAPGGLSPSAGRGAPR